MSEAIKNSSNFSEYLETFDPDGSDYQNLIDYFPFPTLRPGQEELLEVLKKYLLDPQIRYIIVEAATGTGKSGYAVAAALASNSAYIATANKFLQDQYMRDFAKHIVDLKGRANYKCYQYDVPDALKDKIGEFFNCANSPCQKTEVSRKDCSKNKCCEYHQQLIKASEAKVTSFNFASALAFLNYLPKQFPKRNLLVCDECHNIPNWVTNFVGIEFNLKSLRELGLEKSIPDYPDVDLYAEYLFNIQVTVNRLLDESTLDASVVSQLDSMQKRFKLFDLVTKDKRDMDNFVIEKVYNASRQVEKIAFKPVVIDKIVDRFLFKNAKKVIFFSATVLDFQTYMAMLGLPKEKTAILRVPTTFPVANRLIYTSPSVGYINQRNLDQCLPEMVTIIDYLLRKHPDVKGIIHGVTYKICNYLFENLESNRVLYPKTAREQKAVYDEHCNSKKPTILLSPSMTEGVDLFDDISRLQIIAKMPYAYLGCPVTKRRTEIYPNYYDMLTALTLTQAYGRSVRSVTDYCVTYILDCCFHTFCQTRGHILQQSFLEAIR